jgi:hypothetical protein
MLAIRSLCRTAIQLEAGRVVNSGEAGTVVADYLAQEAGAGASVTWGPGQGPGDEDVRLLSIQVLDSSGEVGNLVSSAEPFGIRMEFDVARPDRALCVGFDLAGSDGTIVLRSYQTDLQPERWPELDAGRHALECTIPPRLLNGGRYSVLPRVSLHYVRWIVHGDAAVSFEVHLDHAVSPFVQSVPPGIVAPPLEWRVVA